ncbi:MAG: ketoacyl-ACP synthase III [Desulfobulbaceae bacterium]|nr:ketoacyl-ACP synthase III [Desulfobulbaceae bacterium]HIJ79629.1 ketoacyl-ACP synthase III [Deltaproteobacteria bacterium]
MKQTCIVGTGSCLPVRVLTNEDLASMVDTSDEWITTRTGIKTRHIASAGESTFQLATQASRKALDMAGLVPADIDMIILGTISCEKAMPSCACLVQKELGAVNAFALDVNAACSGFLYGLDMADKYIRNNPEMKILVIGAENLSARTNWQDRNTCVLFGDGAGACVVTGTDQDRGMLASKLYADGSLWELLHMDNAPSLNPELADPDYDGSYIKMVGRDVFKYAVRAMEDAIKEVLAQQNLTINDIQLIIPHQANIRILNSLVDRLGVPAEKVYINVQKYGNTSAATVPIALDEANREGRLQQGDLLLICTFGGGFTWGATVIRW